jgi:hypothetical protein
MIKLGQYDYPINLKNAFRTTKAAFSLLRLCMYTHIQPRPGINMVVILGIVHRPTE